MALFDVKTEIPDKTWTVGAGPGDAVAQEGALRLLWSTKTEIPVPAPEGGIEKAILVNGRIAVTLPDGIVDTFAKRSADISVWNNVAMDRSRCIDWR